MDNKRDYYEVLGLEKESSQSEIKKAYRKLAKEYHPDHNDSADAEKKFKEVRESYEILSDKEKRSAYDQFGHAGTAGFGGAPGANGFGGSPFDMGDLGDIINNMFGGGGIGGFDFGFGGGGNRARRGADIKVGVRMNFKDAIWGKEIEIEVDRVVLCSECEGTGAKGKKTKKCKRCDGKGRIQEVRNTMLGGVSIVTACPECGGKGEIPEDVCDKCDGNGRINESKKVKIKIPEGSYDGMILRFGNGGNAGDNGGGYGDLYVELMVEPHDYFERKGDDIYVDINIPVSKAVLGGVESVRTIHGDVDLKIPKGTQSHSVLRLSNKGASRLGGGGFGDQYVRVVVDIPKRLNRKERKLWEELNS